MEACLPKVVDRGPLLLTLGAAGATVLVMLAVLFIPALDACRGDGRGLVNCLRGIVDDKFDLGLDPPLVSPPPAQSPTVAEAATAPETPVAAAPVLQPSPEPTRSLAPPVADKPVAPAVAPPQAAIVPAEPELPDVSPDPASPDPAVSEPADAAPAPATVALAEIVELEAPSFVPPPPVIAVAGVPPDLEVVAVASSAPDFALPQAPDLPTSPTPDLVAPPVMAVAEAPDAPELADPVATVPPAAAEPVAAAAPGFVLPSTPALPATPPPDLVVAAVDPFVPADPPPLAAPILAPTIDAVEIDGDGNFIAGNGPAGATMRLYVNGVVAGISPVAGGRWLVEGTDLLTEPTQTLRVEALDPVTGRVIGEAKVEFERPAEPAAVTPEAPVVENPASLGSLPADAQPDPPTPAAEPEPADQPLAATDQSPATSVQPIAEPSTPVTKPEATNPETTIPEIAPVVPAGETPSVTILGPSATPDIPTLTTGAPSEGAVVNLSALPKPPAIEAHFTLPPVEVAADVTVLRAVPIGDPGAGRFVSGKAIIRRGDTLWDIAHRYYGLGIRYRTILRANSDLIARPGRIYPGQVFDLPLVYDD